MQFCNIPIACDELTENLLKFLNGCGVKAVFPELYNIFVHRNAAACYTVKCVFRKLIICYTWHWAAVTLFQ